MVSSLLGHSSLRFTEIYKRRTKLKIFILFLAKALSIQKNIVTLQQKSRRSQLLLNGIRLGNTTMALAIKAIPTLYGDEARRFREMADETERKYDMRPKRDLTTDPRYKAMRTILERSNIRILESSGHD